MITLEKKTFRILSYCAIPQHIAEETWLTEFSNGCYVELTVEQAGTDSLHDWILENVEGVSPGQTILIHIDY